MKPCLTSLAIVCVTSAVLGYAQQPSSSPTPASSAAPPSERVVIKVGDMKVTQAQFETMVSDLEAQQGPADLTRQAIGSNYAQLLMLSQQAADNHLDTSPEVLRQLALDRNQILSNAEFVRLKSQAKPTPEEISAYYSAHLDDYDTVQLRRVFIWSHAENTKDGHALTSQAATALAAQVRKAYAAGGDAQKVIHDTPHDPSDVMVDPQPLSFQRGELPDKMQEAVFALKEGEFTEFDDVPGTFVFMRVVKRGRRDLKEVSPQIEKKLQAQKLKEELDDLKKKTGIWMDEAYFAPAAKKPASSTQSKASVPTPAEQREEKDDEEKRQQ